MSRQSKPSTTSRGGVTPTKSGTPQEEVLKDGSEGMPSEVIEYDDSLASMDLEAFQQRVIEAFELYTESEHVHRSDLLDLLEDVGIRVGQRELDTAIQAELAEDDEEMTKTNTLSRFDLDDVQSIALRFFLARKQGNAHVVTKEGDTDVDIGLHRYIALLLTCRRKKNVNYIVRRPSCNVDLTPKQVLMVGAGVVLVLMCLLVLAVISILWLEGTLSSEKTNAIRTAVLLESISTEIVKEELVDRLTNIGDAVDLFRKVLRESYQINNKNDAGSLNNKVLRVGQFLNDLMDGRHREYTEILAGLGVVKQLTSRIESRAGDASGFLKDVGIPAMDSLRTVTGGGASWDVVVSNTTQTVQASPSVLFTGGNCSTTGTCVYSGNPCAFHSEALDRYRTYSTKLPSPGGIGTYLASTVSGDVLQLTMCIFKPLYLFSAEYYGRISTVYTSVFQGLLSWRFVEFNLLDGTAHPITHYTPIETVGVASTDCEGGCEEVYARRLTTYAAGNCSSQDQCRLYGVPQGVLDVDLIDNSSVQVSCASSSIGAPLTLTLQMFLCRKTVLMKTENIETMRTTINTVNRALLNASRVGVESSLKMTLFTRDTSGSVAQITDYEREDECIGVCIRDVELLKPTDAVFSTHVTTSSIMSDYQPQPCVQGVGYVEDLDLVLMVEHEVLSLRADAAQELIQGVLSHVSDVSNVEVVAVSNHEPYQPSPTYLPTDPCDSSSKCISRDPFGVVYRSNCLDCVRGVAPGSVYSLSNITGCPAPCDLSGYPLYSQPFNSPSSQVVETGEARSGKGGGSALYIAIFLADVSMGVVLHFDISERFTEVYEGFAIGYSSFVGLIVVALVTFWFVSRRNLDALEGEWMSYKKHIRSESVAFASVVTSVLPAAYVPLLFVDVPQAHDRMNLSHMVLNVVGFQKLMGGREPSAIHDHSSYLFHVMRTVVTHMGLYSVKTFGDSMFVVGGLQRRHTAIGQDTTASESFTASEAARSEAHSADDPETAKAKLSESNAGGGESASLSADASASRCVEAASVILQLISHLYEHNPRRVEMLKKFVTLREFHDLGALRVGVSMGSSLCFVSRVSVLPRFEVMGEQVSVAHRLQQAAKVNSINITRDVKNALQRSGDDVKYVLAKDRSMMYRKAVVHTTLVTQGKVPIPELLLGALHITRATPRLFFDEHGGLQYTASANTGVSGGTIAGERSTISSSNSTVK